MGVKPVSQTRLWLRDDGDALVALPYLRLCRLDIAQPPVASAAMRGQAEAVLLPDGGRRRVELRLEGMAGDAATDALWQADAMTGALRRYRWQLGEAAPCEAAFKISHLQRRASSEAPVLEYRLELTASGAIAVIED